MPVLRRRSVMLALAAAMATGAAAVAPANDGRFPYDLELLMDTRPMPPGKRMPSMTVAQDGKALLDLWCRSVRGVVEVGAGTVAIQAEPLPANPPDMQSRGQCTPARMQADEQVLAALTQMTSWQRHGQTVVFSGATTLRFTPSSH
ncbi:MAG: META domain-containing protein [Xanthobacteraceae bacterium]|uniref:META domain-containing protein n=1 Tax=Pseudolabrys sp. TaxID=1960880 RepID=UPI003D149902